NKVTITGTVLFEKAGVSGVKLTLDGHPVDPTDEQGQFSISGVTAGSHTLVLRKLGFSPRQPIKFTVGKTDKELGRLLLSELVPVTLFTTTPPSDGPGDPVPYRADVWLIGTPKAMKEVKSVSYDLPAWTRRSPHGARHAPFCYSVNGKVDLRGDYTE